MRAAGASQVWGRRAVWLGGAAIAATILATSCFSLGAERVERDRAVGRAALDGLEVDVRDGLAVVRDLTADAVHLWANAPTLEVELLLDEETLGGASGAPRPLDLLVENCMPRAELEVRSGAATVTTVARDVPTECAYRLEVGSSRLTLRLADPDADTAAGFHFGVLSDIQEAIDRVGDVYRRINQETQLAFVLGAGDLTRRGSEEELRRFQKELKALHIPYYTTLGNHELGESPPPFHDYFGRGNSSFVFRDVRFTLLDSASATIDPEVYEWLDDWLTLGRDQVHVVAMHIPPLDPTGVRNGAFASRSEATKLLSRLARGKVDLTLYGHIHSYYGFQNAGIPAHISGGGGAIPERFDALGRHFLDVTVEGGVVAGVRVVRVD